MPDIHMHKSDDGKFHVDYQHGREGGSEVFDTEAEAVAFMREREDRAANQSTQEEDTHMSDLEDKTPAGAAEPAASRMSPEDAEQINSDVTKSVPTRERDDEKQPSEELDEGAGNRTAPHETKEEATDPKNEKGRAK